MKKIIIILLLTAAARYTSAQVAVVDSKKILGSISQLQKADSLVKIQQQQYMAEYTQMLQQYQQANALADSLVKLKPGDTATTNATERIGQLKNAMDNYVRTANDKLAAYRNILVTPYQDKANAAIKAVATRLKYRQVIDIQTTALAWYDAATDITAQVIKALQAK